jgi:hypothetical protein
VPAASVRSASVVSPDGRILATAHFDQAQATRA